MSGALAGGARADGARAGGARARAAHAALSAVAAVAAAALCGQALILLWGESPARVYRVLLEGTWGNAYGLGQVLYKTTTLLACGLAVALPLRAGLFNIGGEGQLAAGALAAALVGLALPAGTPWAAAVPACLLGAAGAGALSGALPGWLRARFGAHEVINTIMLNFVLLALCNYLVTAHLAVPETLHTGPVVQGARLARLSGWLPALHGSAVSLALPVALAAAGAAWWLLARTRRGFELRAFGLAPGAAELSGVPPGRTAVLAMALGGALAGLGGCNFVLGYKGYYEDGFTGGAGFVGIAAAVLGRSHPAGVAAAALLLATLSQGGLAINALVPRELCEILQAVLILAVAAAGAGGRRAA